MNRVLVTGGVGTIGAAVVRRLLRDPAYEVRVSDRNPAPQWMREGCEIHQGDLRQLDEARRALRGCSHVIHLAALTGGVGNVQRRPHTILEVNNALSATLVRAALDQEAERFVYVSSSAVFERATVFPTRESDLAGTPVPASTDGFSKLAGERYVKAAHDEHGLRYTICRPAGAYGPGELPQGEPGIAHLVPDVITKCLGLNDGEQLPILGDGTQTRTLTYVDDIADGIVAAMSSQAGLHEDFNLSAPDELTVSEIAGLIWEACGHDPQALQLEYLPAYETDVARRWTSAEKASELLGWQAQVDVRDGIAATVGWLREHGPATVAAG